MPEKTNCAPNSSFEESVSFLAATMTSN